MDFNRISHAYILSSPAENAQTMAFRIAEGILCTSPVSERPCGTCASCRKMSHSSHPDFITVAHKIDDNGNEKKNIEVDQIRELVSNSVYLPNEGDRKVYLILTADSMNTSAQNALLKLLEEPPTYITILLATENPNMLLPTIRSRCVTITEQADAAPDPEVRENAQEFIEAIAKQNQLALWRYTQDKSDLSVANLTALCFAVRYLLTDMLTGRLPKLGLTGDKILNYCDIFDKALTMLSVNTAPKHILSWLGIQLGGH